MTDQVTELRAAADAIANAARTDANNPPPGDATDERKIN